MSTDDKGRTSLKKIIEHGSIEMGRRSKKIDPNELQIGDHIYTDRKGKLYDHHGIYVGDDRVIHFSRINPEKGSKYICSHGGDDTSTDNTSTVRKTCVNCFRRIQKMRHKLYKYEYNEGFLAVMKLHSSRTSADNPDRVVDRANKWLQVGDFGEYNFLWNNCETFAYYCKTGILRVSKQVLLGVSKVAAALGVPLRAPPPCLGEISCLGPPPCLRVEIGCFGPKTVYSALAHPCFGPKLNEVGPTLTLTLQAETGSQHTPINEVPTLTLTLHAESGSQHTPIQLPCSGSDLLLPLSSQAVKLPPSSDAVKIPPSSEAVKIENEESCCQ